jgi:hypothetical protein
MPYIPRKERIKYNTEITTISNKLLSEKWEPGHVNYIFTTVLLRWFYDKPSYKTICLIIGTLFCVGLEFYRKRAAQYEDLKEEENGPI